MGPGIQAQQRPIASRTNPASAARQGQRRHASQTSVLQWAGNGCIQRCRRTAAVDCRSEASADAAASSAHGAPLCSRRSVIAVPPLLVGAAAAIGPQLLLPQPAVASKLGGAVDSAWEALGGGPADLYFPEQFLGTWDVVSTLVKVETPLGEDKLPNPASVRRAKEADLGQPNGYQVAFVRNKGGKVIFDRRFNVSALMSQYYPSIDFGGRITWDPNDPNILQLRMPKGGLDVRTRVTRRSEVEMAEQRRIETSEYIEQVFDLDGNTRVKASQCFTKYLYRDEDEARRGGGGPAIVATQVVSDYLTPYDGEAAYLAARGGPVAVFTYKMQFTRRSGCVGGANSGGDCAAIASS